MAGDRLGDRPFQYGLGLAYINRCRQHGEDLAALEGAAQLLLGRALGKYQDDRLGAFAPAASTAARTLAAARASMTRTCARLPEPSSSRAASIVSTGRTAARPSRVWPSSSRKSSRVVIAVTSTVGCALAGAREVEGSAAPELRDAVDGALATWVSPARSVNSTQRLLRPHAAARRSPEAAQFAHSATAGYVASRPTQCVSSQ
jgi:hypothetical protein